MFNICPCFFFPAQPLPLWVLKWRWTHTHIVCPLVFLIPSLSLSFKLYPKALISCVCREMLPLLLGGFRIAIVLGLPLCLCHTMHTHTLTLTRARYTHSTMKTKTVPWFPRALCSRSCLLVCTHTRGKHIVQTYTSRPDMHNVREERKGKTACGLAWIIWGWCQVEVRGRGVLRSVFVCHWTEEEKRNGEGI